MGQTVSISKLNPPLDIVSKSTESGHDQDIASIESKRNYLHDARDMCETTIETDAFKVIFEEKKKQHEARLERERIDEMNRLTECMDLFNKCTDQVKEKSGKGMFETVCKLCPDDVQKYKDKKYITDQTINENGRYTTHNYDNLYRINWQKKI